MKRSFLAIIVLLLCGLANASAQSLAWVGRGIPTGNCSSGTVGIDLNTGLLYGCGGIGVSSWSPQGTPIFNVPVSAPTLRSSARPAVDVTAPPFNAAMDCVTDDTAAINNAITAAHRSTLNCGLGSTAPTASCTGVVLIPNGCLLASQIVMQSNVTLEGTGWENSVLLQKAGANENFIVGTTPATDQRFYLHDLFINGNASAQTGTGDCIHFDSTGSLASSTRSPRHTLQNLFVANCKQDAISLQGDAGSEYLYNVKGMNSGRYGLNINVFDSHVDVAEFAQNGTAGIFTGTNGNGSIASVKSWGNGTGTTGTGYLINAPNYRFVNDEAQDNACNGFVLTGVSNFAATGLYSDGNGQTGGGLGCAGLVLSNVTGAQIEGAINGVVDAGTSDYGISFSGTNTNNNLNLLISNTHVAAINGSVGNNSLNLNGNVYNSAVWAFENGAILRWFSDVSTTQQASINGGTGQMNVKTFNAGSGGYNIDGVGGTNNFDFTNLRFLSLNYGGGIYQFANGCGGTGCPANDVVKFVIPVQLAQLTTTGDCVSIGTSGAPADVGYHCTQPRATFSGFTGTTFTSGAIGYGGSYTPGAAITVTGVDLHLDTSPAGCTTLPQTSVYDMTGPTVITGSTITMVNGTADYHVTLSANSVASHRLAFGTTVQGVGCTTNPTSAHYTVEYVMQ